MSTLVEVTMAGPGWSSKAGTSSRNVFPHPGGPMTNIDDSHDAQSWR